MNRETRKMLLRSIRNTLSRFLAILAITALGVGFYAGLKTSQPDMLRAADDYMRRQRMYDFQLMSSLGFTPDDAAAFRQLPGISAVDGSCSADAYARVGGGEEEVWHFQTLTGDVAIPELLFGRLPETDGEALGDSWVFKEADLGAQIVLTDSNDTETLDHFAGKTFVLVGLVRTPRYISPDRGSSTLGSGSPKGFVFLPESAFTDKIYHELLLWCDLPGKIYSEEYSDALNHRKPAVETLLNRRGVLRQAALREELGEELEKARRELAEGWSEYRLGKRKAEQELRDAELRLQAAQAQLDAGRPALAESEAALSQQESSLAAKQQELAAKKEELQALMAEQREAVSWLLQQELALQTDRSALDADRLNALQPYTTALAEAYAALLALQSDQLTQSLGGLKDDLAGLSDQLSEFGIDLGLDALPDLGSSISDAAIEAAEQERARAQKALDDAQAELDDPDGEYAQRQRELDARDAALQPERDAHDARGEKISALDAEIQALQTEISTTSSILAESRRMLESSRAELESGAGEIYAGWAEYNAGKEKAEKELEEARKKLEDGEKELAAGERELEEGLQLDLYTLDRRSNPGYVTFENDSAIVDGIAVVFPVFFVLVAALVCITTMTRMVNEERTQIGTLKAMGYSSPAIMAKYLIYAGLSALIGCVLGFFIGCTGLPYIVWYAYNIMYQYQNLLYAYSTPMFFACLSVSVIGSLFVTWLACRSALRERPAELIRPKAPAVGKRVLLERIPFVWNRLPFLSKVSIRNAFRFPSRVLMMLLGIGGCTALMVAGFGAKDSLSGVGTFQYEEISLYDVVVHLDAEKAGSHPELLWADWAEASQITHREEITLQSPDGAEKDTTLILSPSGPIEQLLSLHSKAGTVFPWPDPGEAIITRKLSEDLGLKIGDSAVLRLENGKTRSVVISGVCEYYVGHAVFAAPDGFADTGGNYALIRVKEGEDISRRAASLRSAEGVNYVSLTQTERETLEASMQSLDLLVLMLVFCSGALAFITLYNLTNINIMERIREVATVKVLGFTPHETGQYILNENLMLSFLGAGFGLLLGKLLHRFVMEMLKLDYMSYDIRIAKLSYLLSFAVTILFALLTNLVMRRKLEKVNMAESLKSVE